MSAIIEQLGPERTMLTLTLKKIGDKRKDEDNDHCVSYRYTLNHMYLDGINCGAPDGAPTIVFRSFSGIPPGGFPTREAGLPESPGWWPPCASESPSADASDIRRSSDCSPWLFPPGCR